MRLSKLSDCSAPMPWASSRRSSPGSSVRWARARSRWRRTPSSQTSCDSICSWRTRSVPVSEVSVESRSVATRTNSLLSGGRAAPCGSLLGSVFGPLLGSLRAPTSSLGSGTGAVAATAVGLATGAAGGRFLRVSATLASNSPTSDSLEVSAASAAMSWRNRSKPLKTRSAAGGGTSKERCLAHSSTSSVRCATRLTWAKPTTFESPLSVWMVRSTSSASAGSSRCCSSATNVRSSTSSCSRALCRKRTTSALRRSLVNGSSPRSRRRHP
ncbi:MAG: hypothetical protein QM765_03950 [Myxococcales bacterium]